MRLASQGDHYSMPRLLVVLSALAQLHSTVAFALVTRPTLPLAKANSVHAELRMAESSSDSGLEFFQAGVLPAVAATPDIAAFNKACIAITKFCETFEEVDKADVESLTELIKVTNMFLKKACMLADIELTARGLPTGPSPPSAP